VLLNFCYILGFIALAISLGLGLYAFMSAFERELDTALDNLERMGWFMRENFTTIVAALGILVVLWLAGSAVVGFIQDWTTVFDAITKEVINEQANSPSNFP
jgi:hypothetical protein